MKFSLRHPQKIVKITACYSFSALNMINKYFSELLRPPVAAMNVGADIIELHLGVGSASVGLKMPYYIRKCLALRFSLKEGL